MSGPTTAREAAVRVLMGDFSELLSRFEKLQADHSELQDTQQICHTELDADLEQLGGLVRNVRDDLVKAAGSGEALVSTAKRLESVAARIEVASSLRRAAAGAAVPSESRKLTLILGLALACASAWAIIATVSVVRQNSVVQLGKATLKAWPALNEDARRTIKAVGSN